MIEERDISNLFHGALDTEPPAGAFQRLQLELEHSTRADVRRRGGRIHMTRNRMVLLAAGLALLLIVTFVVGGRVYRELHPPTSYVPAAAPSPSIDRAEVARLLARPLKFTKLNAGQPCPADGPSTNGMLGSGPTYGSGSNVDINTTWGAYATDILITPPGLPGPIIVRALDLKRGELSAFLGPYGAGPISGTDLVNGKSVNQYSAVALDTSHSPTATYDFGGTRYVVWHFEQGWPHSQIAYCAGLQIDGPTFTEVFYGTVTKG